MSLFGAVWMADRRVYWPVLLNPGRNSCFGSVEPGRFSLHPRDQITREHFPVFKILFPKKIR